MIRLRTLGSLDLRVEDGTEVRAIIRQPKRLAILAYLALARPRGFQRRDVLLGRFWPETDTERARHALSQQVYSLRQRLGADAIVGRGDDEVGIAEGRLWCDAIAFEDALKNGDPQAALDLYHGPLLDGFFVSDAPGFEKWLDEERERLRRAAHGAAMQLAAANDESPADAVRWVRRALELSPWDEPTLRRLIALLDAAGDRAGALQAYDDFARRIEMDLELQPSAETARAIEALRAEPPPARSPAIARHEGRLEPRAKAPAPALTQPPRPEPARGRTIGPFPLIAAAAIVLLLALVSATQWMTSDDADPPALPPASRVAVLFLNDESRDGSLGAYASIVNDAMISELARIDPLEVLSQASVRPYRNRSTPPAQIAHELKAGLIIGGNLVRSGDVLLATVEIVSAVDGTVRHRERLQAPANDIIALADSLNRSVLGFLPVEIGREIRREEWTRGTDSPEALVRLFEADELRRQALAYEQQGELRAALSLTNQADSLLSEAIALDPDWAEPYVLAARLSAHGMLLSRVRPAPPQAANVTNLDRALAYVERALDLDPACASAFETRGDILFRKWATDSIGGTQAELLRTAAENALDTALDIQPDRARAQLVLARMFFMTGRLEEARDAALRAHQRDVFLEEVIGTAFLLFQTAFAMQDDDEASFWCDETGSRSPDTWFVGYCRLALLAWSSGSRLDPRLAWNEHRNAGTATPDIVRKQMQPMLDMLLAAALANAGEPDSARVVIARTELGLPRYIDAVEARAAAWVTLGEHQKAVDDLRTYVRHVPGALLRLRTDRRFEPIEDSLDFLAVCLDVRVVAHRCR